MPDLTEHELESTKMYHDSFKHLTTFSSGAILLSSSVVAAFFKNPTTLGALYLSLVCFLISVALATLGLHATVFYLNRAFRVGATDARAARRRNRRDGFYTGSAFSAYLGVFSFGVFALMNFN